MRVLHLRRTFLPLSQTFIYENIRALTECGIEVHVVTPKRENTDLYPFEEVHEVEMPSALHPGALFERFKTMLTDDTDPVPQWSIFRKRLVEKIRELSPDVLHAHFGREGVWLAPVAEALDLPLVVSFYGYDLSELIQQRFWQEQYRSVLWPTVDAAIFLSEDMKRDAIRFGADEETGHIVHLGRNLKDFPYRSPSQTVRRFLSVGRLVSKKGHGDAIRAVEQVAEEGRDVHLRIVGDGPLRGELREYIQRNALSGVVELAGAKPKDEIPGELARADAFLLCSKVAESGDKEGTPTVLVEAQAVGLPCVATHHAGIPEMIPESNHRFLAPEGDVGAVRDRIERLVTSSEDELRQLTRAGRDYVEKNFDVKKEAKKLIEVYGECAA